MSDLYAKERLPFDRAECLHMLGELSAEDAACFDRCTRTASVRGLVSCETGCRSQATPR